MFLVLHETDGILTDIKLSIFFVSGTAGEEFGENKEK
jgi:hypothetical protein